MKKNQIKQTSQIIILNGNYPEITKAMDDLLEESELKSQNTQKIIATSRNGYFIETIDEENNPIIVEIKREKNTP